MADIQDEDASPAELASAERARTTYRLRRYLQGASREDILARLVDIFRNLYCYTSDAKISRLREAIARNLWEDRLLHVMVEGSTRGWDPIKSLDIQSLAFSASDLKEFREQSHVLSYQPPSPIYCRFGERNHVRAFQEEGEILLRPASYYSNNLLDLARRDDELFLRTFVCPHDFDLGLIGQDIIGTVPERSFVHLDQHKPFDYYLFCVTTRFEIRLVADFCADACLVIRDQNEFERRLRNAIANELPGWIVDFACARYLDPYCMPRALPNAGIEMAFWKHFRYMYQHEFRLVAVSPDPSLALLPRKIFMGSIADISELIALEGHPFRRQSDASAGASE